MQTTLICIPHAGGSATYYAKFRKYLPHDILLHAQEIAGRGRRCREPLATSMEAISNDLFTHIAHIAQKSPYALFGHSMGALLAFLCATQVMESGIPLPQALFVSACPPPAEFCRKSSVPVSSFSSTELWDHVGKLGGIPHCIATSMEFRQYLEPVLYADFTALDTWRPQRFAPLPVPIFAFFGQEDILPEQEVCEWRHLTSASFSVHSFPGNHFYLQDNWEILARYVVQALAPPACG